MSKTINIIIFSIVIILDILIGIITMIYVEIIIIRIYGLDKNIENSIIERAENDDDLASSKINLVITMYIPPKSINDYFNFSYNIYFSWLLVNYLNKK